MQPVKNPLPSECKVGDYYMNPDGWQKRVIEQIDGKNAFYSTWYLENGEYERSRYPWSYCAIAHMRRWSKDGNRGY